MYNWIDEKAIKSEKDIDRVVKRRATFGELERIAEVIPYTTEEVSHEGPYALAGRGMDLTGELDCYAWNCQKKQVDVLFSRTWHYFDKIVVTGLTPTRFCQMLDSSYDSQFRKLVLASQLRLLLYLRDIGAEANLIFRQKTPACRQHFEEHLRESGLSHLVDAAAPLVDELALAGHYTIDRRCDDHLHYTFEHPLLEHVQSGAVGAGLVGEDLARAIAMDVFKLYSAHMVADIRTSRIVKAPLAAVVGLHRETLYRVPAADEHSIALELGLPFLNGVPVKDLIQIRNDEYLSFEKFRTSLRKAIKEKVTSATEGGPTEVANEISRDIVLPSLNEIALKLNKAQKVLTKKSALSVGVGVAATMIGAIAGIPLLLPAGVASALLPSAHYMKYLEEKRDIELADMYFLWKLQGKATP
ncbi:hypothetical protein [Planotetraspora phitsanulokensis]|uniref:hypothetical protein n=1 Tax=Planotetraspora phitsanulokensis TaxID=575192 RepID=UPI001951D0F4|nr:hypothetical protein [Planotetraspora phitsanulokensis]